MAAKLKPPHEVKLVNSIPRLVRENFTARITMQGQPPITIQNGAFFDDGGNHIPKPPSWIMEELKKVTPEMAEKLGLDAKEGKA